MVIIMSIFKRNTQIPAEVMAAWETAKTAEIAAARAEARAEALAEAKAERIAASETHYAAYLEKRGVLDRYISSRYGCVWEFTACDYQDALLNGRVAVRLRNHPAKIVEVVVSEDGACETVDVFMHPADFVQYIKDDIERSVCAYFGKSAKWSFKDKVNLRNLIEDKTEEKLYIRASEGLYEAKVALYGDIVKFNDFVLTKTTEELNEEAKEKAKAMEEAAKAETEPEPMQQTEAEDLVPLPKDDSKVVTLPAEVSSPAKAENTKESISADEEAKLEMEIESSLLKARKGKSDKVTINCQDYRLSPEAIKEKLIANYGFLSAKVKGHSITATFDPVMMFD